jgi:hypothetical protein
LLVLANAFYIRKYAWPPISSSQEGSEANEKLGREESSSESQ